MVYVLLGGFSAAANRESVFINSLINRVLIHAILIKYVRR